MHHAGLIADTKSYIDANLECAFLLSQALISTFKVRLYVHSARFIPAIMDQIEVQVKLHGFGLTRRGRYTNDTGWPSLRLALSSRSMLRPVKLLHEAADDCTGSEEYPRLEMLRLSSCPSRVWKLVGRFLSIHIPL